MNEDIKNEDFGLCPHGRHKGAYCEPCAEEKYPSLDDAASYYRPSLDDVVNRYIDKRDSEEEKVDLSIFDYVDPFDMRPERVEKKQNNGLDAEYYDLPENVRCVQDLIEWLKLDFSNGNILKSIVREHNPDDKKHTDALYEAEKRYYFASRHLQRVRNLSK